MTDLIHLILKLYAILYPWSIYTKKHQVDVIPTSTKKKHNFLKFFFRLTANRQTFCTFLLCIFFLQKLYTGLGRYTVPNVPRITDLHELKLHR